jgi:hypothetical protein
VSQRVVKIRMTQAQRQTLDAYLNSGPEVHVVATGGTRYGGKTYTGAHAICYRRVMFENTTALCLRKVQRSADLNIGEAIKEVCRNHGWPITVRDEENVRYHSRTNRFYFPNESMIQLLYCDRPSDWEPLVGLQWDDIWFEQAEQFTEEPYDAFSGSNRPNNPLCPSRKLLTFNPGGIGQGWLQERIVNPETRDPRVRWIPSMIRECPATLERDPGYIRRSLLSIKDKVLRQQWLDGDWDAQSGLFFHLLPPEEDAEGKVTPGTVQKIVVPYWADWFCGVDWGEASPFACVWVARWKEDDTYVNGKLVRYGQPHLHIAGEVYQAWLDLDEQARLALEKDKLLKAEYPGSFTTPELRMACWSTGTPREGESTEQTFSKADIWRKHGFHTFPSFRYARSSRWSQMKHLINQRILTIDPSCKALIKEFKQAVRKEDAEDIDQKRSKDHALDALSYITCYLFGLDYTYKPEPDNRHTAFTEGRS